MGGVRTFEELGVWQKARELTKSVYQMTSIGNWSKDYGLRDQIRRAAVSVMSNVAEGFERRGDAEFGHFLSMAKGSAGELRSQLYVALDIEYLDQPSFTKLFSLASEVSRMTSGLATYLKDGKRGSASESSAPSQSLP
jgi:four helix bundle protein